MDDPVREIPEAIDLCAGAATADIQVSAFHHYFTPDASFLHPLCYVPAGTSSRTRVIGIYLFYRAVVPATHFDIQYVAFDEKMPGKEGHLFVNLVQTPQLRGISWVTGWAPRVPMHINFQLRKVGGRWLICEQEDVIQPLSLLLAFPVLSWFGRAFYFLCEVMGLLSAWVFMLLGVWRPEEHLQHRVLATKRVYP